MITTDHRAELDAVMAKATAGPWGVWVEPCAHPSSAQQELVQQVEQTEGFVGALYMIEADGKCPATTGCGPTSAANAAAIVALHNAYPLLTATIDAQAAEIARLREALVKSEDAMREMFRYYDGGETRGSYDGKPERAQLRTAWQIARAALASTGAA